MFLPRRLAILTTVLAVALPLVASGSSVAAATTVVEIRPTVPVVSCVDGYFTADILGARLSSQDRSGKTYVDADGLVYDVEYTSLGLTTYVTVIASAPQDGTDVAAPVAGDTYSVGFDGLYAGRRYAEWDFPETDYCGLAAARPAPVYRFWSPVLHSHFFTMDESERSHLQTALAATWSFEGEKYRAFPTQNAGTVPLYRFWSEKLGGHFYTTDATEAGSVVDRYDDDTWRFEGVAYYVYPASYTGGGTLDVSRFWSGVYGHHFYTADSAEAAQVIAKYPTVWSYEGVDFEVPSSAAVN